MPDPAFCSRCGAALAQGAAFCSTCGQAVGPTTSLATAANARSAAMLVGVAWLIGAAADAYLAYLQADSARILTALGQSSGDLGTFALVNGVAAGITAVFGAVLLVSPTGGRLTASLVWGVLSVAGTVLQVASGTTHWTIVVGGIAAGIAAVLSFAARPAFGDASAVAPPLPSPQGNPAVPQADASPLPSTGSSSVEPPGRPGGRPPLLLVGAVLLLVVLAGAGAYVVARNVAPGPSAAPTIATTPRPTPGPTPSFIAAVQFGASATSDGTITVPLSPARYSRGHTIYWEVVLLGGSSGPVAVYGFGQVTNAVFNGTGTSQGEGTDLTGTIAGGALPADTYTLKILQGSDLLAQGVFTVEP